MTKEEFFSKCASLLREVANEYVKMAEMFDRNELPQTEHWHTQALKFSEFKKLYDMWIEIENGAHKFILKEFE